MPDTTALNLTLASTPEQYAQARDLFLEYASQLGVDLCFQGFAEELERLPEMYGPPAGRLLLAYDDSALVGCVGVRPFRGEPRTCEMKRLYVRQDWRGCHAGRALAVRSLELARDAGYERMVLDTLGTMTVARRLYADLGFRETPPREHAPIDDVRYLELTL